MCQIKVSIFEKLNKKHILIPSNIPKKINSHNTNKVNNNSINNI